MNGNLIDKLREQLNTCEAVVIGVGVGFNTPIIIKYPFMRMTMQNKNAAYCCINYGEVYIPDEIAERSIGINSDIYGVLQAI